MMVCTKFGPHLAVLKIRLGGESGRRGSGSKRVGEGLLQIF